MSERPSQILELRRVAADGAITEKLELPIHSGKDPLALLLEAAEDLCLVRESDAPDRIHRIDANDVRAFVIPRMDELLAPGHDELKFVLAASGNEKVSEHTIVRAIEKGVWPTNGSVTLEAAVLAAKLDALARAAAKAGESLVLVERQPFDQAR